MLVATNDEATLAKHSAVSAHVYGDPFVGLFLRPPEEHKLVSPAPEIKRGYFIREIAIRAVLHKFVKVHPPLYVI